MAAEVAVEEDLVAAEVLAVAEDSEAVVVVEEAAEEVVVACSRCVDLLSVALYI